jgi:uncharacterized membrane protein (Fun14 family)
MNDNAYGNPYGQDGLGREVVGSNVDTSGSAFPYLDMGTSFVIGLAIGFFMKKFFKLLLLLLGFGLVILFVMESQGISTVNEQALDAGVSSGIDSFKGLAAMLKERLSNMTITTGAGAVAGFFVGLKLG